MITKEQAMEGSIIAHALRNCALGLLRIARDRKKWAGSDKEVGRLVKSARWYWHWYLKERTRSWH